MRKNAAPGTDPVRHSVWGNELTADFSLRLVGRVRQRKQKLRELRGLSAEEPVGNEAVDNTGCVQLSGTGWTNDRANRQTGTDEFARLGHDQVGLQCLRLAGRQVIKGHG